MRASQEILSNRKAPRLSSALEDAEAETLPPLPRGCGTAKECERGARASKARGETESREGAITRSSSSCSCSIVLALLLLLDCVIVLCAFPCLLCVLLLLWLLFSELVWWTHGDSTVSLPQYRRPSPSFVVVHFLVRPCLSEAERFYWLCMWDKHYSSASTSMFQRVNFLTTLRSHMDVTCSYYLWSTLLTWMMKA